MPSLVKNINPKVLIWARETAHLSLSDLPKSIVSQERLVKIESGDEFPTLTLLEKLAKKYDRPLHVLLEAKIPQNDYINIPFFRRHEKTAYDSSLALFIRDAQKKQDWARNYLLSEGYDELDFVGSISLAADIKKTAQFIITKLGLPSFSSFKSNETYFKHLKSCLEDNHILVSITGSHKSNMSISLEAAQGFVIVDKTAPFIFVNTKNTANAKIFTLIHEVAHLFINESGISEDTIKYRKTQCHEDKVENFCNSIASEVLMPEEIFLDTFNSLPKTSLKANISSLSKHFLVSELAICVRLWRLNLIDYQTYSQVYLEIKDAISKFLVKLKKNQAASKGGNYYSMMRAKNGNLLSQLAFYAYKENKILGTELYNILKIKVDKIENYFSIA